MKKKPSNFIPLEVKHRVLPAFPHAVQCFGASNTRGLCLGFVVDRLGHIASSSSPGDITILPHFAPPVRAVVYVGCLFGPPTTHSGSCAYVRAGEKVGLGFLQRAQQIGAGIPNH